MVVSFLTRNGMMAPGLLCLPPFSDAHADGVHGLFAEATVSALVGFLRQVNTNGGITARRIA